MCMGLYRTHTNGLTTKFPVKMERLKKNMSCKRRGRRGARAVDAQGPQYVEETRPSPAPPATANGARTVAAAALPQLQQLVHGRIVRSRWPQVRPKKKTLPFFLLGFHWPTTATLTVLNMNPIHFSSISLKHKKLNPKELFRTILMDRRINSETKRARRKARIERTSLLVSKWTWRIKRKSGLLLNCCFFTGFYWEFLESSLGSYGFSLDTDGLQSGLCDVAGGAIIRQP